VHGREGASCVLCAALIRAPTNMALPLVVAACATLWRQADLPATDPGSQRSLAAMSRLAAERLRAANQRVSVFESDDRRARQRTGPPVSGSV